MSSFPLYVLVLWGCSFAVQLVALILLCREGNYRKMPLFALYTALNVAQAGFLVYVYQTYGVQSPKSEDLAWSSETITLAAQAMAATEILWIVLRPYKGIWGLAWRLLAVTFFSVVTTVTWSTYSTWAFAKWFDLDRGYHLTFSVAMITCLVFIRYYAVAVPRAYKIILMGFCFYSCTEVLIDTVFRAVFYGHAREHQALWQFATMFSFVVVLMMWVAALMKPLPAESRQMAISSDAEYQRLSPEINEQLRLLNEKLLRLWKMEARSN